VARNSPVVGRRIEVGEGTREILLTPEIVKDWDDEEIMRGRARAKDGSFKGKDPKVIPKVVHDEWKRRQFSKAMDVATNGAEVAMQTLIDIIQSPMAYDRDKIEASKVILERTMGKPREKVELEVTTPKWRLALENGVVPGDDGGDQVIDVEGREVA